MNMTSNINPNALRRRMRWRFNPLRNLNPDTLASQLDAFDAGYLRDAAETWELIEKRDDILRSVIPKRKKAVARHGWVVLPARQLQPHEKAAAERQIAALEHFYRTLECSSAIDCNERGGFSLLVRQMMDAVGKKYAAHEIVWRPKADGTLTASFRFVPLAFFENTTGALRFLETDAAMEGTPLRECEWMITVGDGLMMASSIAWMFKNLSVNDWSLYSERNGTPGLRASTSAARDSDDWKAIEETLKDLYEGLPVVTNTSEDVKVVDFAVGGNIPFPQLVERMDRVMAAMWRGADLSTLSRDRGYGASLQEKESCVLEEDDAQMISETLNRYVDRWVVRYLFGENAEPLARVKLLVSGRECSVDDVHIDEFLLKHGAPLSVSSVLERYGRALPQPGEPLLGEPGSGSANGPSLSHMQNIREPDAKTPEAVRLSNSQFSILQQDWVQLSPYGDFPHAQGLQRVTFEAAKEMERHFMSLAARASRLFAGAPMFVGHPDVPQFSNQFPDRKAYGWIMELEARPDGLYGKMKWSAAGMELLQNGHYKFLSPYWEARQIGSENGQPVFEPLSLISAGLTNEPNLPVNPLANIRSAKALQLANINEAIAEALANGRLTPDRIASAQRELTEDWDSGITQLRSSPVVIHTRAYTEKLGARKIELSRFHSRKSRIQNEVAGKLGKGMNYDDAWAAAKEENPSLFT